MKLGYYELSRLKDYSFHLKKRNNSIILTYDENEYNTTNKSSRIKKIELSESDFHRYEFGIVDFDWYKLTLTSGYIENLLNFYIKGNTLFLDSNISGSCQEEQIKYLKRIFKIDYNQIRFFDSRKTKKEKEIKIDYSNRIKLLFDLIDECTFSMVLEDDIFIFTYERFGEINEVRVPKAEYIKAVKEKNYEKKLSLTSCYVKDTINFYEENGYLYLDKNIPFSRQKSYIKYLENYFDIDNIRGLIYYDGELTLLERILNHSSVKSLKKDDSEESKITNIIIEIKLNILKVHDIFKTYINKRISEIYSNSEDILANVDLTRPIERVERYNVYGRLTELNEKMPVFIEATNFLKDWQSLETNEKVEDFSGINDYYKEHFTNLIANSRQELINQVVENAIAEVEGREFIPREELAIEYANKKAKYGQLMREFCINDKKISNLADTSNIDPELIIARIDSIFLYYESPNPYKERIEQYKKQIRKSTTNLEEYNRVLEEYKQYLLTILNESEKVAIKKTIDNWKNAKIYNPLIYGSNPLLHSIHSAVEQYYQGINKRYYYEVSKNHGVSLFSNTLEETRKRIVDTYDSDFQSILDRIDKVNDNPDINSMCKPNPDKEYALALKKLIELTQRVKSDLEQMQLQDSMSYLYRGSKIINIIDPEFDFCIIFAKLVDAQDGLSKLKEYLDDKSLFNYSSIKEQYDVSKNKFDEIVQIIFSKYTQRSSFEEYQSLLEPLDSLIKSIRIVCENETILLEEYNRMKTQRRKI